MLEEKKMTPVGSEKPVAFNARIIAVTNKNLAELVHRQKFREDLYYRLCGIGIVMPPLRERLEQALLAAMAFCENEAIYPAHFPPVAA